MTGNKREHAVRFLIVDDDPVCRSLLQATLSPYAHCDLAFGGREAIDAVRLSLEDGRPYDLICLDIMMPGTDGHETLEEIRRLEKEREIYGSDGAKVVMTTALQDPRHCLRSFKEGCESYLTKPIKDTQLFTLIQELLGELPKMSTPETPANPPVPSTSEPSSKDRYLIVDDDRVCRELLKAMLSPYGHCDFAYDGREAIDAVRLGLEDNLPYDLITMDIMMPGTSGHDALLGIRKLEAEQGIYGSDGVKVIMTTALRDSKHCIQSFKEGCESYVTKPVDADELLGKMRELGLLDQATV